MAQKSGTENKSGMDIVQQRMLSGLAALRKKRREQPMFTLGAISDEVRIQTDLKVVLSLKQMAEAKRPLLDEGLIEDLGCGYNITHSGLEMIKHDRSLSA